MHIMLFNTIPHVWPQLAHGEIDSSWGEIDGLIGKKMQIACFSGLTDMRMGKQIYKLWKDDSNMRPPIKPRLETMLNYQFS